MPQPDEVVRTLLIAADDLARDYGRKHLGHYLRLSPKKLVKLGLDVPDELTLQVDTKHTGYCIRARSAALNASDPWYIASISATGKLSPDDSCRGFRRS